MPGLPPRLRGSVLSGLLSTHYLAIAEMVDQVYSYVKVHDSKVKSDTVRDELRSLAQDTVAQS